MKRISLVLVMSLLVAILSGCSITVNGKKLVSFNENNKGFSWSTGNNTAEKTEVKDQDIGSQDKVKVSNAAGKIVFKVWDKNTVHVAALKKVRTGGDKEKLDRLLDDIKVEVQKTSGSIDVDVKYINRMWGFSSQSVELEVTVPGKIHEIKANSASGEILIDTFKNLEHLNMASVSGSVEMRNTTSKDFDLGTTSGIVKIGNINGNGNIHTVSGSIEARNAIGDLRFKTTSGSVQASGIEGKADASTVSGSVNMESKKLMDSEVHTISGSINIQASEVESDARIKINSTSGEVNLILPQDSGFKLDASSTSGDVRNDFSDSLNGDSSRKGVNGTIGNGGADIEVYTVSGGINIRK